MLKIIVKQRGGGIRGAVLNLHMCASMSAFVSGLAVLTFANLPLFKPLAAVFQISAANSLCPYSIKNIVWMDEWPSELKHWQDFYG
jgi:hypothetical protein